MFPNLVTSFRQAWRVILIVFGFTLFAIGAVMLFLPGPGLLSLALALGILAGEFVWAARLLERVKSLARRFHP